MTHGYILPGGGRLPVPRSRYGQNRGWGIPDLRLARVTERRLRRAAFSLLTAGFAASPLLRDSEP